MDDKQRHVIFASHNPARSWIKPRPIDQSGQSDAKNMRHYLAQRLLEQVSECPVRDVDFGRFLTGLSNG